MTTRSYHNSRRSIRRSRRLARLTDQQIASGQFVGPSANNNNSLFAATA